MKVPLSAIWPPILLFVLDGLIMAPVLWLGWWPVAVLLGLGLVVLVFDFAGRRRDFRNAHAFLVEGGKPSDIARSCQFSWCGRVACQAAADRAGAASAMAVRDYYRAGGYRWFHVFPDNTFTLRSPFLKLRFWRVTLFGNHYASAMSERAGRRGMRPVRTSLSSDNDRLAA